MYNTTSLRHAIETMFIIRHQATFWEDFSETTVDRL